MAESQDFRSSGPNRNRDGTRSSFGHQEAYNVYSQYTCSSFSEGRNFSSFQDEYSDKGMNSVSSNSSESYPRERYRSREGYSPQFRGPYHYPSRFYASSSSSSSSHTDYSPYSSTYNYEDSYSHNRETNPRYKYNYMKSEAHTHRWNKRFDRDWSYRKNDRFDEHHQSEKFHKGSRNSTEHRTSLKRYKPSTEAETHSRAPAGFHSIQSARKRCQSSSTSNFQQHKRENDFSSPSYPRSKSRRHSLERRDVPHNSKESRVSSKRESQSLKTHSQSDNKRLTSSELCINSSSANDKNGKIVSVSATEKSVANLISKLYPEISKSSDIQSNINFTSERVSTDVNVVLDNTQDKKRTCPDGKTSEKDVKGKNTSLKSSVLSSTNKTQVIASTKVKNSVRTETDSHLESNTSGKRKLVEIKIQVQEVETSKTVKVLSPPSVREIQKEDTLLKSKALSTVSSKNVNFSNVSCSDVVSKVFTEKCESKSLRVTRCTKYSCDSSGTKLENCDAETKEITRKISVKDSQSETVSTDIDLRRITRSKAESAIQVSSKTSLLKSPSNSTSTTEIVESKRSVIRPKRKIVNSINEAKCPSVVLKSVKNSPKTIPTVSKYKSKRCNNSVVPVRNNATVKKSKKFKFGIRNKRSVLHKVLRSKGTSKCTKTLNKLRTAKIIAAKKNNSKCLKNKLKKSSMSNKKMPAKKLSKAIKQVARKSEKKPLVKKVSGPKTKFVSLKNLQKNATLSRQMAAANSKIRLSKVKKASSCLIKQQVQKARKSLVSKADIHHSLVSKVQLPIKKKKKKYFRGGRYSLGLNRSSKKKCKKSPISDKSLQNGKSPEQNRKSPEQNKQHSARKSLPKNLGTYVNCIFPQVIPLSHLSTAESVSDMTVSKGIQQLSSMQEESIHRFSVNAPSNDRSIMVGRCRKTCVSNNKIPGEMPLACILRNSMDLKKNEAAAQAKGNTAKKSFVSARFGDMNKKFTQNFMMTSRRLESSVTLNNDGFERTSRLIERQFVFSTTSLCEKLDNSSSQESKNIKYACSCRKLPVEVESNLSEDEKMCQAVDMIDGKMVGCSNHFQNLSATPSPNFELIVMCQPHLFRLQHHQCCPVCGVFCSQGVFVRCKAVHQQGGNSEFHLFHHKCLKESSCPHCMKSSDLENVKIVLNPDKSLTERAVRPPSIRNKLNAMTEEERYAASLLNQDNFQNGSASSASLPPKPVPQGNQAYKRTVKAFHSALKLGNAVKVQHYLGGGGVSVNQVFDTDDNNRPLHIAAGIGHIMLVKMLVKCGADLEEKNDQLSTPLMLAIKNNHAQVAEYLLGLTRNVLYPDIQGATCFHAAAQSGNKQLCELIYESEARLDLDLQDEGGWTALVWACEHKHHDVVRWLLLKGANPDIRDREGNIALHWAAFSGATDIVTLLIEYSSCINPPNLLGNTPLHIAAKQAHYDCAKLLLNQGADVAKKNYDDCTAYMLCKNPNSKLAQLLQWYSETLLDRVPRDNELLFDVSNGREFSPISVVNGIDDEEFKIDFKYVVNHCESSTAHINATVIGMRSCQCVEYCQTSKCRCYSSSLTCYYKDNQRLIDTFNYLAPPVIYECSRLCHCHRTCINRVVQHGTRCRLQVFRTKCKGWGLRAVSAIPKGTFVCQYIGELLTDADAKKRTEDSYMFELKDDSFCIDSFKYGNVSRFLNHSCEPNVVVVEVYTHHHDQRFPSIAFFTNKNVEPKEELCYDYGVQFWAIKCQDFLCACDSELCKFNFNTIESSLNKFYDLPEDEETFTEHPMFLSVSSVTDEPVASTSTAF